MQVQSGPTFRIDHPASGRPTSRRPPDLTQVGQATRPDDVPIAGGPPVAAAGSLSAQPEGLVKSSAKIPIQSTSRQIDHSFERAWLLKQVGSTRNHLKVHRGRHRRRRLLVEPADLRVALPDDK